MLKLFTCSFWPSCGYHIREELVEDSSSRLECLRCWAGCLVATGAYLTAVICSHFKHIHNSSTFLLVLDAPSKKKNCAKSLLSICYSTEMKLFIDVQFKARRKTSKLPAFGQGMFLNELQIELVTSLILYWHLASCWRPTTSFIDGLRMTMHWKKLWAESTLFAFF